MSQLYFELKVVIVLTTTDIDTIVYLSAYLASLLTVNCEKVMYKI